MEKFAELLKIKDLLPITPEGRFVIEVTEAKGKDFTIKADLKAAANVLGIKTLTIESATLADLGVVAGSTAYFEKTKVEEQVGEWAVAYTAPEKQQVARESAKEGRGRTPNFSTDRSRC